MKTRFLLFNRAGVFYNEDTATGKQTSLRTKDRAVAASMISFPAVTTGAFVGTSAALVKPANNASVETSSVVMKLYLLFNSLSVQ